MDLNRELDFFIPKIKNSQINFFSTPNFFIDEIFTDDLARLINKNWPKDGFMNEVKGNSILPIYRSNYQKLQNADFWSYFNENLWPSLVASIARKFELFGSHIFGANYQKFISLDHPLTLMQANNEFLGHDMHTHFYHAPHWAFTVLIYIDNEDYLSEGTTLHTLQPEFGSVNLSSSCLCNELKRSAEISFDTFRWLDPQKPERKYLDLNINYKFNRLFTFMDGPLALHSVNKYSTINEKIKSINENPLVARRRILRSHIKVHHQPFYEMLSNKYGEVIDPTVFMKLMSFDPEITVDEAKFKNDFLFQIYFDMVKKHSELQNIHNDQIKLEKNPEIKFNFLESLKSKFLHNSANNYTRRYIDNFNNYIP